MKRIFLFLITMFILGGCAVAETVKVDSPWARPGKKDGNSAAYFVIENNTKMDDRLVSAKSSISETSELHMTKMDSESKMMMMPQESIDLKAGDKVIFEPGGYHVMLLNLKKDLQVGEKIKLTLTFEKAGNIELDIPVKE
jgi:copper(I)-binding protein